MNVHTTTVYGKEGEVVAGFYYYCTILILVCPKTVAAVWRTCACCVLVTWDEMQVWERWVLNSDAINLAMYILLLVLLTCGDMAWVYSSSILHVCECSGRCPIASDRVSQVRELFLYFWLLQRFLSSSSFLPWKPTIRLVISWLEKKKTRRKGERERERESSCFELWWEVTRLTHRTDKSAPSNSQPARPSLRAPPVSATVQSPCPGPSRIVCAPKPKTTLGWLDRSGRVGKLPREPLDRVFRRSRPSIARALCSFRRLTVAIRESYVDVEEEEHIDTCIFRDSYSRTSTEYSTNFCSYVHVGNTASYTYTRTAAPRQYVDVRSAGPTGRRVCDCGCFRLGAGSSRQRQPIWFLAVCTTGGDDDSVDTTRACDRAPPSGAAGPPVSASCCCERAYN